MKRILSFLIAFVIVSQSALALSVPTPNGHVNDLAGILDKGDVKKLENKLVHWEQSTSNEMAILIIPSLEGEVLEQYSVKVAQTWGVGQKDKDNGLFLLIAMKEKRWKMDVGYGLEGVLPDGKIGLLLDNTLPTYFRAGDFYGGLDDVSGKIIGIVGNEYTIDQAVGSASSSGGLPIPVIAVIVVIVIILLIVFISVAVSDESSGGGYSFGRSSGSSSWGSSGSSGGFGGFGGGGFGGGGCSGGW